MNAAEMPLIVWFENAHRAVLQELAIPTCASVTDVYSGCELLGHHILLHFEALGIGLCGFEAWPRAGDSAKKVFQRSNEADKRRRIHAWVVEQLRGHLLDKTVAAERWAKVLILQPWFANAYLSKLHAQWDRTSIAEKFLLLGGEMAAQGACGKHTLKELAELAVVFCGRGTMRSLTNGPDVLPDRRYDVSFDQMKDAREKVALLLKQPLQE